MGGPYLQDAGATSIVVAAVTVDAVRLRVDWTRVEGPPLRGTVSEVESATLHGLRLEGLEPDTHYIYSLSVIGGTSAGGGTFRTFPLPGTSPRRLTIAVVSDTGETVDKGTDARLKRMIGHGEPRPRQAQLASVVAAEHPDLVLHLGDVEQTDGAPHRYREAFFVPFARLIANAPIYPVIGNHDAKTGAAAYLDAFHLPRNAAEPGAAERYYSFDCGPVHVTALDVYTSPFLIGSRQHTWLEQDLAGAQQAGWRIVTLHPPLISAGRSGDAPDLVRDLAPLFERYRVSLVLSGHDHNYQRFHPIRGVTYVVSGGGNPTIYDVRPEERHAVVGEVGHYLLLNVEGERITVEARDFSRRRFDLFGLERPR